MQSATPAFCRTALVVVASGISSELISKSVNRWISESVGQWISESPLLLERSERKEGCPEGTGWFFFSAVVTGTDEIRSLYKVVYSEQKNKHYGNGEIAMLRYPLLPRSGPDTSGGEVARLAETGWSDSN